MSTSSVTTRLLSKRLCDELSVWDTVHKLPIDSIAKPEGFQRENLNQSMILSIIQEFDPLLYKPIEVCKSKDAYGKDIYYVSEGMHRWSAAKRMGMKEIRCFILPIASDAEGAKLMLDTNKKRQGVNMRDTHSIGYVAGFEQPREIERLLKEHGFRLDKKQSENCLAALGQLQIAYKRSPDHLDLVLQVLREAYDGSIESLHSKFVKALSCFLWDMRDNSVFNVKQLVRSLRVYYKPEVILANLETSVAKGKKFNVAAIEKFKQIHDSHIRKGNGLRLDGQ